VIRTHGTLTYFVVFTLVSTKEAYSKVLVTCNDFKVVTYIYDWFYLINDLSLNTNGAPRQDNKTNFLTPCVMHKLLLQV